MMEFGSLFDGKYRILRLLGAGGCGRVYLAENIRVKSLWAIKEITCDGATATQTEREIETLRKAMHPALPRIIDVIRDDGHIYLIEDYFEGSNAEEILKKQARVEEGRAIKWALEICGIMTFLHGQKPEPIIYRDLKPSNIIVSPDGSIKLVDFGSVRQFRDDLPSDTIYIGTRGYAAPEQYGFGQSTKQTDVYNFGITMLQIATGIKPAHEAIYIPNGGNAHFPYENGASTAGVISGRFKKILYKCIEYNPENRYSGFDGIAADLCECLRAGYGGAAVGRRGGVREESYKEGRVAAGIRGDGVARTCNAAKADGAEASGRERTGGAEVASRRGNAGGSETSPRRDNFAAPVALPRPMGIYRCLTISVTQNHEFAFELAYRAFERYGLRAVILDFDFENTLSEWYFNAECTNYNILKDNSLLRIIELINREAESEKSELLNKTGTDSICGVQYNDPYGGAGRLSQFTHKNSAKPEVLCFNEPNPENSGKAAELLLKDRGYLLRRLLSEVTVCADICLLLTGRTVFCDLFARCFENSHYVICPGPAESPSVKSLRNTAALAERHRRIPANRFKYIIWDSTRDDGVNPEVLCGLAGDSLAGIVRKSKRRDSAKRGGQYGRCYAVSMEKAVKMDYDELLTTLGVINN